MTHYPYLIIGGDMTAAAAVDGIREVDSIGGVGLISAEMDACISSLSQSCSSACPSN